MGDFNHEIDTAAIAKDLGVSTRTIQSYCKEGFLPANQYWENGKLIYRIEKTDYLSWKYRHFKGVKRGNVSKFSRLDRDLTKNQIRELMKDWLNWCETGKLNGKPTASRTLEIYEYYLNYFLNKLSRNPKMPIVSIHNFRLVLGLIPIESYSTRRHVYDAVMSFSKYLIENNKFENEEREKIRKLRPRRFLPARKTVLTQIQLERLLKAVDDYKHYHKYCKLLNLTLIHFIANSGLRANEVCNLRLEDVDLESKTIYVNLGKGNKNRRLGISKELEPILIKYLRTRVKLNSEYFFLNKQGGKLCPRNLCKRLKRIGRKADIDVTPHGLRRTFVTINANKGKPLNHLRIACGHSNISTTQGYCMTSVEEVVEAMKDW